MFWQVIRNIPENVFPSSKYIERQLHAGHPTKLLTVDDAIQLIMVLPGQTAMEVRIQFAVIIRKFFGGDQILHAEINANAVSNAPICQLARASVNASPEPVQDTLSLTRKRRMEELQIEQLEVEIASKKLANEAMARDSEREHLMKVADRYRELCQDTVMDERMRLMLKDGFMNIALAAQKGPSCQRLLTNNGSAGDAAGVSPNEPISISSVADDLKLKFAEGDWQKIGLELSNRYNALHGDRPPKHKQLVGAQILKINDYYERDRPLMEEVLRWYAEKRESEHSKQASGKKDWKKGVKKSEQINGQKNIQSFMSSRQ
jgi:hypothetical protein